MDLRCFFIFNLNFMEVKLRIPELRLLFLSRNGGKMGVEIFNKKSSSKITELFIMIKNIHCESQESKTVSLSDPYILML